MSARNRPQQKKLRKLRKALRVQLPTRLDLVYWLRSHGYAQTAGEARRIILDGRVISESHTLGKTIIKDDDGNKHEVFAPLVPARLRPTLQVKDA